MRLLLVANIQKSGRWSMSNAFPVIKAQIENSLELGWPPKRILLVSNKKIEFMGIKSLVVDLNNQCLTGSKVFAVKWAFEQPWCRSTVWAHDLDIWQNYWFSEPEFKDVGICCYSTSKYNGGSVFWKPAAKDIIDLIVHELMLSGETREEPTLNKVLKSKDYSKRVTTLNETYNVGCSGFTPRFARSKKPIFACHLNPYNRIAWETHRLNRNGVGFISVSPRLELILRKYFPHLATELTEEGKIRSDYHKKRAIETLGPETIEKALQESIHGIEAYERKSKQNNKHEIYQSQTGVKIASADAILTPSILDISKPL